ncbi:MAG: hypothetical protein IPK16_28920 [Anaerolineales bacterium]|nr:hypothetical protein [Anaerolineales bacterium]
MAWPTPQEYNEAIQNPRTAFADPELQLGQPVLTKLGLPRPITGAFASVYQLVCPNQRIYAVRCFLREFGDSQERYAAISDHLARANLPYTVNFTYLDQGIRVGRQWYPILKMEWIDGETLHGYVARHLNNPQALLDLAEQWVNMTQELRTAQIGHGDLQHGNVLVVGNRLRLIDYDGMYVPALNGRMSHEAGHRNYQHPQRTDADFGPDVDYFSTWVIYTSLVALSVEPQMWQTFKGGDECLIFRREDYERPTASSILRQFDTSPDPRLRSLAGIFRSVISLPADQTPPLDGKVDAPKPGTTRLAGWIRDSLAADATGQGSPSAANHSGPANGGTQTATTISKPAPAPQTAASSPATPYQASWIADFITPTPTAPVDFSNSFGPASPYCRCHDDADSWPLSSAMRQTWG